MLRWVSPRLPTTAAGGARLKEWTFFSKNKFTPAAFAIETFANRVHGDQRHAGGVLGAHLRQHLRWVVEMGARELVGRRRRGKGEGAGRTSGRLVAPQMLEQTSAHAAASLACHPS